MVTAVIAPAHIRSIEKPGTLCGRPASRAAVRPMVRPWSPIWVVAAIATSSTRSGGSDGLRRISSRMHLMTRSSARVSAYWPLALPNGVRTPSTKTTSRSCRADIRISSGYGIGARQRYPGVTRDRRPVSESSPRARRRGIRVDGGAAARQHDANARQDGTSACDRSCTSSTTSPELDGADALTMVLVARRLPRRRQRRRRWRRSTSSDLSDGPGRGHVRRRRSSTTTAPADRRCPSCATTTRPTTRRGWSSGCCATPAARRTCCCTGPSPTTAGRRSPAPCARSSSGSA